ncbi:MAG: hypothetical protein WCC41_02565, partial [Rhodomicrobium sp.]
QSSGKPSILLRPSRRRHRRATRFKRNQLKRQGKSQFSRRNFGLTGKVTAYMAHECVDLEA